MIVLTSTDKIQIKLAGAVTTAQLNCFASYRDTTTSSITPGRSFTTSNDANTVDLVGSPGASTQRIVDYISIHNSDTTTATVTLQVNLNSTIYVLSTVTLLSNERLEYQEGIGFKSLDAVGAIKQGNELGYNSITGYNSVVLSSDVINNNSIANTIADITGLSFSVTSGKTYWFRFVIPYTSAVSSTGARFSINGPATSALYYESQYPLSSNNFTVNCGLTAYDQPAASNASAAVNGNIATVEGIAIFSANGTLIGRFASEVANSAITAKAGAVVYYKQLD